MITVAAVLRSGGEFEPEHAQSLAWQVREHLSIDHRFVLLTDFGLKGYAGHWPLNVDIVHLEHDWPGWFAKVELFKPGRFKGRVLYMDLDTKIVGNIDALATAYPQGPIMLRDFYWSERVACGLMAWTGDELAEVYGRFAASPNSLMEWCGALGEQPLIRDAVSVQGPPFAKGHRGWVKAWQDLLLGQVVSYKAHVLPQGHVPRDARVVCFHGQPRPWNVDLPMKEAA